MDQRDPVTLAMHRRFERSAAIGFGVWCVWGLGVWAGAWGQDEPFALLNWLTLLAPSCITPLSLRIARIRIAEAEQTAWRRLMCLQPLGAACALVAFAFPRGAWATAIAIPWALAAWQIARVGSARLRARSPSGLHERALDVAFLNLFVAAFMMVTARSGYTAFGLIEPILTLASTHFYFAGFALLVIGAELGRILLAAGAVRGVVRVWAYAILGVMISLGPIAAGVMAVPVLELVGSIMLAASGFTLGAGLLFWAAPRTAPRLSAVLLAGAGLGSMIATVLGAAYAVSSYRGIGWPAQPVMIWIHGPLQAIVVSLGGLLGFAKRAR
jgi:hypothetical protein